MTISTTQSTVTLQGNGSTTVWPYSFLIDDPTHAVVQLTDGSSGIVTTLGSTQYNISGIGNDNGGNVTYPTSGSAIPNGTSISISRVVPVLQNTSITNQGGFYPQVIEEALDYLTMAMQQVQAVANRCYQAPIGYSGDGTVTLQTVTDAMTTAIATAESYAAALSGTTSNSFYTAGTGAVGTENDIGVNCNGFNKASLVNKSDTWGLYSASGGPIISYQRASNTVNIGNGLTVTATALQADISQCTGFPFYSLFSHFTLPARSLGTTYYNTTGMPMLVSVYVQVAPSAYISGYLVATGNPPIVLMVPSGSSYGITGGSSIIIWAEQY